MQHWTKIGYIQVFLVLLLRVVFILSRNDCAKF